MSKWVEVPVTIFKTFAVEIEDGETIKDAKRYALEECMGVGADTEIGDCFMAEDEQQGEQVKRLADEVLSF